LHAPYRSFNANIDLGAFLFQCPKYTAAEIKQRELEPTAVTIGRFIFVPLGCVLIAGLLTVPLIRLLQLPFDAPLSKAIALINWLIVLAVGYVFHHWYMRRFFHVDLYELNLHERGFELKMPRVQLRALYDQIAYIRYGPKSIFLWRKASNAAPQWMANVLTIAMLDGLVVCVPRAKAIFQEDVLNAMIERYEARWPTQTAGQQAQGIIGATKGSSE
jgi:hypothetical protein